MLSNSVIIRLFIHHLLQNKNKEKWAITSIIISRYYYTCLALFYALHLTEINSKISIC